ncbi:E3 binding domain-containing protein [Sphaerimonospora sp. CA-214678]|uniref:E3 binding domain-containing protein n=1 Tax=Sphaerimonospora sp. CA-214678 TaxID=3240029 RepID=UPI003D91F911
MWVRRPLASSDTDRVRLTTLGAAGGVHRRRTQYTDLRQPPACRLAKQERLPLEELHGTGPGGRIIRRDVETAIARLAGTAARPLTPEPRVIAAPRETQSAYTETPHSRMRSAIASRLTERKRTSRTTTCAVAVRSTSC